MCMHMFLPIQGTYVIVTTKLKMPDSFLVSLEFLGLPIFSRKELYSVVLET